MNSVTNKYTHIFFLLVLKRFFLPSGYKNNRLIFLSLVEKGTRMYSSRMRTARFSGHLGGGGVCLGAGIRTAGCMPGRVSTWEVVYACENFTFPQGGNKV